MPKRKKESKEERWRRKLKRYEEKLNKSVEEDVGVPKAMPNSGEPPVSDQDQNYAGTPERERHDRDVTPAPATDGSAGEAADVPQPPAPPERSLVVSDVAPNHVSLEPQDADIPDADPELLQALGVLEAETIKWGRDIYGDLALRWELLLKEGLKKETKEELLRKYLPPKNCPLIKSATLNPEVSAMLNDSAKNRDTRIVKKQDQLGCVLTILGRTITDMLKKSINTSDILSNLSKAANLLADSHFLETETRRSLITPMIDKNYIEPFKERKRDSHLFGEKLGDFIKSSRGIQKTGKLIQSNCNSNTLNPKGPPVRQHQNRMPRPYAIRAAGGGKVSIPSTYHRRAPPPYPAAAARTQSAPPGPGWAPRQRQPPAAPNKRKQ